MNGKYANILLIEMKNNRMKNPNHEYEMAAKTEAEQTEYKKIVRETLQDIFGDVLDGAELEKRLQQINDVQFVTPEQMDEIAKNNPKDAGASGLIRYEIGETEVKRIPIVMTEPSRAETLHTLLHESVHLMTPPPVPVYDPMRENDKQYFSDYIGAYSFNRLKSDKSLDHMSFLETVQRHNELFIFWEAVTDWIATESGALTNEELKEVEESGYFERHWIYYLVKQCSNGDILTKAIKESYVQGNDDSLRRFLQIQTGTEDDRMYDELLHIIGKSRKKDAIHVVDEWMSVVNKYFQTNQ